MAKKEMKWLGDGILRGGVSLLLAKVIGAACSLFLYSTIAKMLGAQDAGIFFFGLSVCTILATVARLGADNAVLKIVSQLRADAKNERCNSVLGFTLLGASISWIILFGIFLLFVAVFKIVKLGETEYWATCVFLVAALPVALYTLFTQALQGVQKQLDAMMIVTVWPQATATLLCIALIPKFGLLGASIAYAIASFSVLILSGVRWRLAIGTFAMQSTKADFAQLYASSAPLFLASISQVSIQWSTTAIAGLYISSNAVGGLGLATRIAALMAFVFIAFNSVIAPKLAVLFKKHDIHAAKAMAKKGARLMIGISTPIYLVIMVSAELMMGAFGPEYVIYSSMLRILATGQYLFIVFGPSASMLIMSGNEKIYRNLICLLAVLHIGLIFSMSIYFGALGAAASAAIGLGLQNIVLGIAAKRKIL